MRCVLAAYGTRGDVEPSVVVARELGQRGHDVRIAVPPDHVGFAESLGLTTVAYGPDSREVVDNDFGTKLFENFPHHVRRPKDIRQMWRDNWALSERCWSTMTTTLMDLARDADVLCTGLVFEDGAANIAEYYRIPLATLHYFPLRPNGRLLPYLPAAVSRAAMTAASWLTTGLLGSFERAQRRDLGLPKAFSPSTGRVTARGALEIQAYDPVCFPGLAEEWARWGAQRPFTGTLTLALPTAADDEVASWIAEGTPPICFGFGSMPMESPADTIAMIGDACAELGERAVVCAGLSDFTEVRRADHVKLVDRMNYAEIFPLCRAVVHHGGAGSVAAGLRAGVPTLILWAAADRQMWGAIVKELKVGTARRFSATTSQTLAADLRHILNPACVARARAIGRQMSTPTQSAAAAADLVENLGLSRRIGATPDPASREVPGL